MDEALEREVNLLHANICQGLSDPKRILMLTPSRPADARQRAGGGAAMCRSRPCRAIPRSQRAAAVAANERTERPLFAADERVIDALDILRSVLLGVLRDRGCWRRPWTDPASASRYPWPGPRAGLLTDGRRDLVEVGGGFSSSSAAPIERSTCSGRAGADDGGRDGRLRQRPRDGDGGDRRPCRSAMGRRASRSDRLDGGDEKAGGAERSGGEAHGGQPRSSASV